MPAETTKDKKDREEFEALKVVLEALLPLSQAARSRIIRYAADRLGEANAR